MSECCVFMTRALPGRPAAEAVTVVVQGEIDMDEAAELREAILGCVDPGQDLVVLDLTGVGYFGSAGIRDLLSARDELAEQGVDLCMDGASPIVERVLDLTKVREYFPTSQVVLDLRDRRDGA